ncbi:MAG: adenylate/guanylate cyclase domain-containing protein [Rhodospirillaceae bacterium]|mgnify:CR=1 FL=1|nr:adenylate/guanylate cyclase domain-containing protein [Rhodospirillaceae bacterium]MBT5566857.1 adenylate/guanylate cyclase domain-containing protein [Rhodospirillaceae bacterium]MBT6090456.1 adenylate/guanylate cyclase domain-containing protein [Rhodospirillaceae bacterium]MBT6961038.1 adenylate/guanylate cyclase domain-containing protein [Rhodospirillaceae bacterium]MBT7449998.1 adenylate/guanylate cyclase domain-containing protein [Rhodospirillaceae bacterium]
MSAWYDLTQPTEMDLLVGASDFTGYVKYCRTVPTRTAFDLLAGYFDYTGGMIADAGGRFVKAIGDAGLTAFRAEDADAGVRAHLDVQHLGNIWLKENGYPGHARFRLNLGPLTCGPLGAPGQAHFDIIGSTVNIAARVGTEGFAMTPTVFRALEPTTRKLFKKHTPPMTYIALEDKHQT